MEQPRSKKRKAEWIILQDPDYLPTEQERRRIKIIQENPASTSSSTKKKAIINKIMIFGCIPQRSDLHQMVLSKTISSSPIPGVAFGFRWKVAIFYNSLQDSTQQGRPEFLHQGKALNFYIRLKRYGSSYNYDSLALPTDPNLNDFNIAIQNPESFLTMDTLPMEVSHKYPRKYLVPSITIQGSQSISEAETTGVSVTETATVPPAVSTTEGTWTTLYPNRSFEEKTPAFTIDKQALLTDDTELENGFEKWLIYEGSSDVQRKMRQDDAWEFIFALPNQSRGQGWIRQIRYHFQYFLRT